MTSVELRIARPADALAVAKVHVRSWRVGYRDLLPHDYLDALRPEEQAQRYTSEATIHTYPLPSLPKTTALTACGWRALY
jgi:hypothetical protein